MHILLSPSAHFSPTHCQLFTRKTLRKQKYPNQSSTVMLQSKQISRLLSQGLTPINIGDSIEDQIQPSTTLSTSPLSLLLLSPDGIPLTTVLNAILLTELGLTPDTLKIYSLVGFDQLNNDKDDWGIVQLEGLIKMVIQRLSFDAIASQANQLYAVLFYEEQFPDAVAKLKLDNISAALNKGLKGYSR